MKKNWGLLKKKKKGSTPNRKMKGEKGSKGDLNNCPLPKKNQKNLIPLAKKIQTSQSYDTANEQIIPQRHNSNCATNNPINKHTHNMFSITNSLPCISSTQPHERPLKITKDLNIAKPNGHYWICQQLHHFLIFFGLLSIPQAVPPLLPKIVLEFPKLYPSIPLLVM